MTPMVDLFFLLLTFFILTSSFRPQEATEVDTPSSISALIAPEKNVFTIYINKEGKAYFNIDNGPDSSSHARPNLLKSLGDYYRVPFTQEELKKFEGMASYGMPIKDVKRWIDAEGSERTKLQTGIPMDSTDNQLSMWIHFARLTNPAAQVTVKGDNKAPFKVVKKVFDMVQDKGINKFNLTTNMTTEDVKPEKK